MASTVYMSRFGFLNKKLRLPISHEKLVFKYAIIAILLSLRGNMNLLQNQTLKASAAFIVFSNTLMLNKLYNGMYWASAIEFATHGLLQFILTVLTLVTLFAALIFGLRDAGRYLPQMNPIVGLVVKVTLFIFFGFVLTEFSRTIFMFISSVSGLNPFAGYKP